MPESLRDALMKAAKQEAEEVEKRGEETPGLDMAEEIAASAARISMERLAAIQARQRTATLDEWMRGHLELGYRWTQFRVHDSLSVTEREMNGAWKDLERKGSELVVSVPERIRGIRNLVSGMYLEERLSVSFQYYLSDAERNSVKVAEMFGDPPKYSPAARILTYAICDMAKPSAVQGLYLVNRLAVANSGGRPTPMVKTIPTLVGWLENK